MPKPLLIWVEQLVGSDSTEVPQRLIESFDIRTIATPDSLVKLAADLEPACIVFDFDYPDKRRLSRFAECKRRFPSVPFVMLTLQHSESLAVWTYRQGALDYLVKPVRSNEVNDCADRILRIDEVRKKQAARNTNLRESALPDEIPNGSRSSSERLSPAVYYVQRNYTKRIYSDAMARLCGMSPTHFSRTFRKTYSLTFQEFLLRYRVQQACRYLVGPTVSVADIAYNVGFTDPSYFARVFKRYLGVSPSEYMAANDEVVAWDETPEDDLPSSSQVMRRLAMPFRA